MKFNGTITHLSQKGLGVVKNDQNNLSYFVYGTWPGDAGEFEIIDKPLNNNRNFVCGYKIVNLFLRILQIFFNCFIVYAHASSAFIEFYDEWKT